MVRDATKGAGNAIVPQVAAEILRCMMRVDSLHNNKVSDGGPLTHELKPQRTPAVRCTEC